MGLYSSVNRVIYEHVAEGRGGRGPQYIPRLRVTEEYIRLLGITEEYIFIFSIFLGTDEYSDIYSLTLYSSITLRFMLQDGILVGCYGLM
jgi:hypothetical protein